MVIVLLDRQLGKAVEITPANQALNLALASGGALPRTCRTCSCCSVDHMVEIKTPAGALSDPQQLVMAAVLATGISNKGAEPDTVIGTLTDSPVLLQPSSKTA